MRKRDLKLRQFLGGFLFFFFKSATFESRGKTAVAAAILCLVVYVCDVMNEAGIRGRI